MTAGGGERLRPLPDSPSKEQVDVEHRQAFASVGLAFQLLQSNRESLERLIRGAERMESVGFILDPTLARQFSNSENAQAQVRIARLATRFVRDLEVEVAKLPAGSLGGGE